MSQESDIPLTQREDGMPFKWFVLLVLVICSSIAGSVGAITVLFAGGGWFLALLFFIVGLGPLLGLMVGVSMLVGGA